MTILFFTLSSFSNFPVYKRAIGTGEALAQMGHSVAIAVLDCPENRERMSREAPHCEVFWFRGGLVREVLSKIRMVWRWRPDILYSTSYSVHNLACLRGLLPQRTKTVIEFCELYSRYPQRRLNWVVWEFFALLEYRYVLCASDFLKRHFEAVCRRWHLRNSVWYSPYAYPDYLRPKDMGRSLRRSIVFMASMGRGYGVFEVLEAFEKLHERRRDVELEMIGGGPDKEEVSHWVEERRLGEFIHVRGFVAENDLNGYFSGADVFVSPMHDTVQDLARCPSKLFYYIPYNKPIVTCNLGNPAEILGEYGFYYKPFDTSDMARTFERALSASLNFSYPVGFVAAHSWTARAAQFEEWMSYA